VNKALSSLKIDCCILLDTLNDFKSSTDELNTSLHNVQELFFENKE